ncbi:hypothetical protein Anae109_1829 [Anaeromyxobacter sp. Fw109-5]|nr:hypothetical protein Anae109_1829 [Anaeromyxobacter sp. Fw109-5]
MMVVSRRTRTWVGLVAVLALSGLVSACGLEEPVAQEPEARPTFAAERSAVQVVSGAVCTGTGAHDAHEGFANGCITCHPCGGALGFAPDATLPSGRPVSGNITTDATGTSCTVACHTPEGQPSTAISWSATGPFPCSQCHSQGLAAPAGGSSHPADNSSVEANRTACQSCHDTSRHVTGTPLVKTPNGPIEIPPGGSVEANGVCEQCHLGDGLVLAGKSPPFLVGWENTTTGDWHGARAGTGSGGTLAAPYARGQGPLPCTVCHDAHVSPNAFIFASQVNGVSIPAGAIGRAGVGAEQLCSACHLGNRHAYCTTCHTSDPQPAGSPCFACHGHEGIRYIPIPNVKPHNMAPKEGSGCAHCHSPGWRPVAESVPPTITVAPAISNVTSSSVTVRWTTNEPSSSYVEYGVGSPGQVAGTPEVVTDHVVELINLSGPTTYVFRVRSADVSRNVVQSALSTFATSDPNAPMPPLLDVEPTFYSYEYIQPVELTWTAVSSPIAGNGVQYRCVVEFGDGSVASDSGWISTPSYNAQLYTLWWPDEYRWRVKARDAVTGVESVWSDYSTFGIWSPEW